MGWLQHILTANPVGCSTVMLDRLRLPEIRFPDWRKRQDWGLWLALTKQGFLVHCHHECLSRYRVRRGSVSGNKLLAAWHNWRILRGREKLGYLAAMQCFLRYAWSALSRRAPILSRRSHAPKPTQD